MTGKLLGAFIFAILIPLWFAGAALAQVSETPIECTTLSVKLTNSFGKSCGALSYDYLADFNSDGVVDFTDNDFLTLHVDEPGWCAAQLGNKLNWCVGGRMLSPASACGRLYEGAILGEGSVCKDALYSSSADVTADGAITSADKDLIVSKRDDASWCQEHLDNPVDSCPDFRELACGVFGDLDGDGQVSDLDAQHITDFVAGNVLLSDSQRIVADVNGDMQVTVADAQAIARYASGSIETLPLCLAEQISCHILLYEIDRSLLKECSQDGFNAVADVNINGVISLSDYRLVLNNYGTPAWCDHKLNNPVSYCAPTRQLVCDSMGDIDNDGKLSVRDAEFVRLFVLGLGAIADVRKPRADVNQDGIITDADVTILQQYVDGGRQSLPACFMLTEVEPASGYLDGGTFITLRGGSFTEASVVLFADVPSDDVEFVSSTELRAKVPAATSPGLVDVTVAISALESVTLPAAFLYTIRPVELLSQYPVSGAVDVSPDASISLLFDGPLNAVSVTEQTVQLRLFETDEPVAGTLQVDGAQIMFAPASPLVLGTRYYVWVSNLEAEEGNKPVANYTDKAAQAFTVRFDTLKPLARILSLPAYSKSVFFVSWEGLPASEDNSQAATFTVEFNKNGQGWTSWLLNTKETASIFPAEEGDNILFRVKAEDAFGEEGPYSFEVSTSIDGLAPHASAVLPTGTTDTLSVELSLVTSENARCQYADEDFTFGSGIDMDGSGTTQHTAQVGRLDDGLHMYFIRCADTTRGNVMDAPALALFRVDTSARFIFTKELPVGWSTFKLPFFILKDIFGSEDPSVETVLESLTHEGTSAYDVLWYYDGAQWRSYSPAVDPSLNNLWVFNDTADRDYYIKMGMADRLELGPRPVE